MNGEMGRMLASSSVEAERVNRVCLPDPPPSSSTSYESDSEGSPSGTDQESGSPRADLAHRIVTASVLQQQQGDGVNITTTVNGGGRICHPARGRRIRNDANAVSLVPIGKRSGGDNNNKKKKKPPGNPVSLSVVSKALSQGTKPTRFVSNQGVSGSSSSSSSDSEGGDERSQVMSMLAEQKKRKQSTHSKEQRRPTKTQRKRRRTTPEGSYVSSGAGRGGFTSSTDNIEEGEFFRRGICGGSSSSSSSSCSSEDESGASPVRNKGLFRVGPSASESEGSDEPPLSERERQEIREPLNMLCFGCMWGHRKYDRVASEKLNRLADIFDTHFLTSESRELAHLLWLYYQAEIYQPGLKTGKMYPQWSEAQIMIHIEEHILEPRVFVARSIRKCIKSQRALEMFFFEEDPESRRRTYNEKAMRLWLMFNKRQMDLHGCDYKNMFGYSENMRIDPSQLSRVVHQDRYAMV